MKFNKPLLVLALVAAALFCTMGSAQAEEKDAWVMRPVEKLSRGIANVAFGVFEIPMKWMEVKGESGNIAGLTYGSLRGVCYFVGRVVVGVVDVATFVVPLPGCPNYPDVEGWGYGPIMKPAWVIPVSSDWNNFVYDANSISNPNM